MADYEYVLANGRILDGCGNPWFYGDLGIGDGRIAEIAPPGSLQGKKMINADGCYVSPGFIDIHTHSDLSILVNRRAESAVRQGVTTQLIGNCGMSPAPVSREDDNLSLLQRQWGPISFQPEVTWEWTSFAEYLQYLQQGGVAINIASLAGHGALRIAVMGLDDYAPEDDELDQMKALLAEALQAGAFGMSTGLVYPPGCFAGTGEIISLCRVVGQYHGFYASHIRGERETILEAVEEAIRIGREANVPVQISHNAPKFGAPQDAHANLRLVEQARSHGQDVTVDNDLHTDLAPALSSGLPQEIEDLPPEELEKLLSEPARRQKIRREITEDRKPAFGPVGLLKHAQWQRITMLHAPKTPWVIGKTMQEIADERQQDPFEVYFDLIVENGHEASSDGQVLAPYGFLNDPPPYSPCSYGEFPGVLERYVRQQTVLTLQEAIRKMTSFPAQRLGLRDRGRLHRGAWADIVVFDLERMRDRATNLYPHTYPFENYPHQYPEGIHYVFVNGRPVVEDGEHSGVLPGIVLRHSIR
jgi:N-acyl-D-amino-acid deacylase